MLQRRGIDKGNLSVASWAHLWQLAVGGWRDVGSLATNVPWTGAS